MRLPLPRRARAEDPDEELFDPRLMDPNYLESPPEVQRLRREGFEAGDARDEELARLAVREAWSTRLSGLWLFPLVESFFHGLHLDLFALGLLLGLGLGELWNRLAASHLGMAASAMVVSFALELYLLGTGDGSVLAFLLAPLFTGTLAAATGVHRMGR